MKKFEEKFPFCWLILGLILTLLSYGIFNTGICAWIFAIYGATGNWFPWICATYSVFAILSGFVLKKKEKHG